MKTLFVWLMDALGVLALFGTGWILLLIGYGLGL